MAFAVPADVAPESRLILAGMDELGLGDMPVETAAQVRALSAAEAPLIGPPREVGGVEESTIAAADPDREIPIRLYHPLGRPERAILWIHGGGWVVGSLESADSGCRALCLDTSALV
ncbi:MAG: alpha/beta hydrolase fold domain-containing protein, partial [Actinobacteria bacterium]|nr:alpha/beta hydrolase fold domain-containing protein [Actinomycetota bacterium]